MNGPQQTGLRPAEGPGGTEGWTAGLDRRLALAVRPHGVGVDVLDRFTVRFTAVPLSADFSKARTNLLLRRAGLECGSSVFADCDLAYRGADRVLAGAMAGPAHRNWRRLRLPPIPGAVHEVFCAVLSLVGSALAPVAAEAVAARPPRPREAARSEAPIPGRVLAAAAEAVAPEAAAAAWRASVRTRLAQKLSAIPTRAAAPRAAVLWGEAGCGRDHLLLAAAHPLLESGRVRRAWRVSGPLVAAGCLVPQEIDASLMHLLAEAEADPGCLLLVEDLDLCVTGTPVSLAVLCRALDRGLCLLASVRGTALLRRVRNDPAAARRLAAVYVPPPSPAQTARVLEDLARPGRLRVAPSTIGAAASMAAQEGLAQPGGALGLLAAALADAAWEGRSQVEPDDLFAVIQSQWPGEEDEDE